jgi:hypothetical protein
MYLCATNGGFSIMGYIDLVSFIIVPLVPYGISVGVTKKFDLDEDGLNLFGDLCIGCALIGTTIGVIGILQELNINPDNFSKISEPCAIALVTILYGFIGKYLIVKPIISCKKNC